MEIKSLLDQVRQYDADRADLPGEHLIVLGVGVLLLLASSRSRSLLGRALVGAAAGAFIGRAASGSGGIARLAQLLQPPPRRG